MAASLNNLNWQAEAEALIADMRKYVHSIQVSSQYQSSEMRIYFDIETLDGAKLLVSMDSSGFKICNNQNSSTQSGSAEEGDLEVPVYETINSLLDHNSPKYRLAFAEDLANKVKSLE